MSKPNTNRGGIYSILNRPMVYRLNRFLVAPGGPVQLRRKLRQIVDALPALPANPRILDVACGPDSWLEWLDLDPIGIDLMPGYMRHFVAKGHHGVVGAADQLPFAENTFDAVWTMALLHHLPDDIARRTVDQMIRAARPGGTIAILDGIYPDRIRHNPIGYAIRAADRGGFMRSQQAMCDLLPQGGRWQHQRFNIALTRLPFLFCTMQKPLSCPPRKLSPV